jgi:hypothetical protein
MSTRAFIVSLVGAATAALLGTGCQSLECADGTHEADGECVPGDQLSNADCGPGTHVENGMCTPDFEPTVCDPDTTLPEVDPETGVTTCHGIGGGGCESNLPCPNESSGGKHTICGRIFDVQTGLALTAAVPNQGECGAGGADDIACELSVRFVDALVFAGDITAGALTSDPVYLDDCGRFRAQNVAHPGTGAIGVAVDDEGANDNHVLTGVALLVTSGQFVNGLDAYSCTVATEQDWSDDVGVSSLLDQGVFVAQFLYDDAPAAGVTITAGGSPAPASDYYWDDVDPTMRTSVSTTQSVSGPNGLAMITDFAGLPQFSGQGGIPATCEWTSAQAGAVPGVLFFSQREAVLDGTNTPCPPP